MNRRKFIRVAAVSVGGLTLPLRSLPAENDIPKEILKPASMITPKGKFYVLQIDKVPVLKAEHWRNGDNGVGRKTDHVKLRRYNGNGVCNGNANSQVHWRSNRHRANEQCDVDRCPSTKCP